MVVSCDGPGVPLIKAAAVQLEATRGTGEKRQRKQEALVGVSDTVDPKPRAPDARAELLGESRGGACASAAGRTRDEAPRAQHVRRVASLVRTTPAVMQLIKADAERRDPQHRKPLVIRLDGALCLWRLAPRLFTPWKRVTCGRDIMPVVGDLWAAANAWFGEAAQAGQHWRPHQLPAMRRGRVGDVIGGLRQILTKQRRGPRCGRRSRRSSRSGTTTGAGCRTTGTWRWACPSGPAWWSRPAAL